jgi:hypothetical protein
MKIRSVKIPSIKISVRTMRGVATGVVGAGAVSAAMLFGGSPTAEAAPVTAPATNFAAAGPSPAIVSAGWGHGGGGRGGWGHGGWGHGGWGHYRGWHGWHGWVNGVWRNGRW